MTDLQVYPAATAGSRPLYLKRLIERDTIGTTRPKFTNALHEELKSASLDPALLDRFDEGQSRFSFIPALHEGFVGTPSAGPNELLEALYGQGGVLERLYPRWVAYQDHRRWRDDRVGSEPTFYDPHSVSLRPGIEALDPCPEVDAALGETVRLVTGSHTKETIRDFRRFLAESPEYGKRAAELRQLTGYAEYELERTFAAKSLQAFEGSRFPDTARAITDMAEDRLERYLRENDIRTLDAEQGAYYTEVARRIYRLQGATASFPYVGHYESLAYGEVELLRRTVVAEKCGADDKKTIPSREHFEDVHVTFPGSGALPLTGLMIHILTGARVNLVDLDGDAVHKSRGLITALERLDVLSPGFVRVHHADAKDVPYRRPGITASPRGEGDHEGPIETDVLYLASLIPGHVRAAILDDLKRNQESRPPVVMMREVTGLSDILYEPVDARIVQPDYRLIARADPLRTLVDDIEAPGTNPSLPIVPLPSLNINSVLTFEDARHRSWTRARGQEVLMAAERA